MSELVKNRSEILFVYDVTNANPNGDPLDENKPRLDEETGTNIVTDVRLKRTIRDYLHDYKKEDVFIREIRDDKGNLKTKEDRLRDFKNEPEEVIKNCIDIRLFGATTAVKDKTMALTGPVQFKYGRSLHRVNLTFIKGTTVMHAAAEKKQKAIIEKSEEGEDYSATVEKKKKQGTFTERYILPYSLIAFYGVVNENAAISQSLELTHEDISLMLDAMWNGTKNLISGSKFGQMPRLLMHIVYKEENFYLGELDRYVSLVSDKNDEAIRDISDVKINITNLIKVLSDHKDKIGKVQLKTNDRLSFMKDKDIVPIKKALTGLPVEDFLF